MKKLSKKLQSIYVDLIAEHKLFPYISDVVSLCEFVSTQYNKELTLKEGEQIYKCLIEYGHL